jgi:hypothetical protein
MQFYVICVKAPYMLGKDKQRTTAGQENKSSDPSKTREETGTRNFNFGSKAGPRANYNYLTINVKGVDREICEFVMVKFTV